MSVFSPREHMWFRRRRSFQTSATLLSPGRRRTGPPRGWEPAVPASVGLSGATDDAAGHLRRFEREMIEDVVRGAGLELVRVGEVNRLGAIGWRLHHASRTGSIGASTARLFDWLVPVARNLDPVLSGPRLSLLVVARVP